MTAVLAATQAPAVPARRAKPSSFTYVRYELLRTFRNQRFLLFSLGFPLLLFVLVAGPNKHEKLNGINFATYYMVGMLSWGSMTAIVGGGARIAVERSVNWHRQLRITPMSARTYFSAKVIGCYTLASLSIGLLYAAGMAMGVRLSALHWLELTGYVLVALVPFAVLGIILGHLLNVYSIGPGIGGLTSLFAILGGAWGPRASGGLLGSAVKLLPSYWLVRAGNTVVGGSAWPAQAWIVIAVWTLVGIRIAVRVYGKDTARV